MARINAIIRAKMKIKIGTRASALALAQTELLTKELLFFLPEAEIEVVRIKTTGDLLYEQSLVDIGGKALFVKEIEDALVEKKIDIAVHSMKDMSIALPAGLKIGCVLSREDRRDAFVSLKYNTLAEMPEGSKLGTCSSRRKVLAHKFNDKITIQELRGNIVTRVRKLNEGVVDAIILAVAGLKRIDYQHVIKEILPSELFIPAATQGIICGECRQDDLFISSLLEKLTHKKTLIESIVERAFLKAIGGGCKTPVGIYTKVNKEHIDFIAFSAINDMYEEYMGQLVISKPNEFEMIFKEIIEHC